MPLIIVTGFPCAGATYRSRQLAAAFERIQDAVAQQLPDQPRYKVQIIAPLTAAHARTVYDNARAEKEARAVAYGTVKRALARDTIVIADGMNYIKGWRYQLWCEAKAANTTCCVVQIGTPPDQCRRINQERIARREQRVSSGGDGQAAQAASSSNDASLTGNGAACEEPYPSELLDNLIYRYEEPSNSARWDKPLFVVPWTDAQPQAGEIWTALTGMPAPDLSSGPDAATASGSAPSDTADDPAGGAGTSGGSTATRRALPVRRVIRPKVQQHQATIQSAPTDPNALHAFEKRTSEVVAALRDFALAHPSASAALAACTSAEDCAYGPAQALVIPVPNADTAVVIPAEVVAAAPTDELAGAGGILAVPRLQRLRRQWITMNRAYVGGHGRATGGLNVEQAGDAFVRFLNTQFAEEL